MEGDAQPQILTPEDSDLWRNSYIEAFIDTAGEYYHHRIATRRKFTDGIHSTGYLWDCLRSHSRITIERLRHEVAWYPEVMVMADDHSRDQVPGAPLWPYPPFSVARFTPELLLASLDKLPEDIYVFDSTLSWTLILTHEHDSKRRICCAVGFSA